MLCKLYGTQSTRLLTTARITDELEEPSITTASQSKDMDYPYCRCLAHRDCPAKCYARSKNMNKPYCGLFTSSGLPCQTISFAEYTPMKSLMSDVSSRLCGLVGERGEPVAQGRAVTGRCSSSCSMFNRYTLSRVTWVRCWRCKTPVYSTVRKYLPYWNCAGVGLLYMQSNCIILWVVLLAASAAITCGATEDILYHHSHNVCGPYISVWISVNQSE